MEATASEFRDHALDVLDFWRTYAVDREFGGFIPHLDRTGRIYDDSEKYLVAATRLVYTFSQGVLLDGPAWCDDLARHGADFLLKHFLDREHGGWYWRCRRDGTPIETRKRTYGHDFAMLALTEFHRATGDAEALAMAERTFDLLDQRAWDIDRGAYREGYDRTWTTVDPPWLGQNCQMHALEATLALHEVTGHDRCRERIAEVCRLMDRHLFDREYGCIPEEFHEDWTIDRTRRGDSISIGHQFEWAWLLMRAEAVAPEAVNPDRIGQLMDFAVRHGWDDEFGGVYANTSSTGEVLNERKGFWENCEAVMALLWYARRTGEQRYHDLFERGATFCLTHLADGEHGGWFGAVARDGAPVETNKGSAWKADYHVIQMCAEVCRFLTDPSRRA